MAYDVSAITNYTHEELGPIIMDMILGSKTADLIDQKGTLMVGVKGPEKLPTLLVDPTIQADSCELTATGDVVLDQISIDVAKMAVMEKVCEKDLETKVFRLKLKNGSNYTDISLRNDIVADLVRRLKLKMENLIWQGDTALTGDANLKWFNGYIKLWDNDVNVVVATPSPKIPLATSGNARVGLRALYQNIPLEIINEADTVIVAGLDVVRNYQMDLGAANLYNPALFGNADEIAVLPVENSHIKLIGLPGLTGTKCAYALNWKNLYLATDLANEEEKITIDADPIKKSLFYIQAAWKLGVSYAFGDKIAVYKWS
jgi:hypothetical protein